MNGPKIHDSDEIHTSDTAISDTAISDVVIIGAGPVGLFSVFQCGMLNMSCQVVDALPALGGQCAALYPEKPIYDIPAVPELNAVELIDRLEQQIAPFAPIFHLDQQVVELQRVGEYWDLLTATGRRLRGKALIIAAGAGAFGPNRPPLKNIERYEGRHVHYMVGDREQFRDQRVVIAGGGDSAVDWAIALADVADKIYVIHRRERFRAAPDSVKKMHSLADAGKIELLIPYQLSGLEGVPSDKDSGIDTDTDTDADIDTLTKVIVKNLNGEERQIEADHLLAFFGLASKLGPINDWNLDVHNGGIPVDPTTCATKLAGVYAVGDIASYPHKLKLILTGFAEAAQAAHAAYGVVNPGKALHFQHSTTTGIPVAGN
ncbi:MAG: NAD(P)/FAD-dependent oxidoreductase [Porticoccaceae bacterium]